MKKIFPKNLDLYCEKFLCKVSDGRNLILRLEDELKKDTTHLREGVIYGYEHFSISKTPDVESIILNYGVRDGDGSLHSVESVKDLSSEYIESYPGNYEMKIYNLMDDIYSLFTGSPWSENVERVSPNVVSFNERQLKKKINNTRCKTLG